MTLLRMVRNLPRGEVIRFEPVPGIGKLTYAIHGKTKHCVYLRMEGKPMNVKPENVRIPFGKHTGKSLGEILADDPSYLDWLLTADIRAPLVKAAVAEMNTKYAAEIGKAIEEE